MTKIARRRMHVHTTRTQQRTLRRLPIAWVMASIMHRFPDLTAAGFTIDDLVHRDWRNERSTEVSQDMQNERALREFEFATTFLTQLEHQKSINHKIATADLKCLAVAWARATMRGMLNDVSEGVFIAAAAARGFKVKRTPHGDAYINYSSRSLRQVLEDAGVRDLVNV